MTRWLLICWGFCSAAMARADDVPLAAPSVEVQQILDRWRVQTQKTGFPDRTWKIVRDTRSENFGRGDVSSDSSLIIHVSGEGGQWRLQGESIPPRSLSKVAFGLTRKENIHEEEFQTALGDRFEDPTPFPKRVPYFLMAGPGEERHFWWATNESKPVAVALCAPGTSAACFDRPLFSYLLEGERALAGLDVAPTSDESVEYALLPETRLIAGKTCRVLQIWNRQGKTPQLDREFWWETGEEIRLRRCRLFSPDLVLLQFEDAAPSAPQKVSLLRWSKTGEMAEQVVAVALPVKSEPPRRRIQENATFPEGTVVADFIRGERRMATREGRLRPITVDDLPRSTFEALGRRLETIGLTTPFIMKLVGWLAWPWVLVPVGGICLAWGGLSKLLSKRNVDRASSALDGEADQLEANNHLG